jgi:hypothetical protein
MVNPLAFVLMAIGAILLFIGIFLVVRRRKKAGTLFLLLGLGFCTFPFLTSYLLTR